MARTPAAADMQRFGPHHGINPGGGLLGAVIASASVLPVVDPIHHVSGTVQVDLITLPYTGFVGTIRLIPDAAFTGATGGAQAGDNWPVGKNFTAVAGKVLEMTFDGALWYPSYIA